MTEIRTAVPEEVDAYLDALVRKGIFANKAELVRSALVSYVSETGTFFRGFDAENIFAPDGRLYQIEYARESSSRGLTAAGLVCEDGVLLAAEGVPKSKLAPGLRKIESVGDRVAIAYAGLVADALLVIDDVRAAAPKTTDEAVRVARSRLHRHTLERMQRPLGVAILLASVLDRKPRLFYVDPSGTPLEHYATALGRRAASALEVLEARYRKMRLADAEKLVQDVFGRDIPVETVLVRA